MKQALAIHDLINTDTPTSPNDYVEGGIYIVALLAINLDSQNNSLAIAVIQYLQHYQRWPCRTFALSTYKKQPMSIEGFRHCYTRFDRAKSHLSFRNRLDSN